MPDANLTLLRHELARAVRAQRVADNAACRAADCVSRARDAARILLEDCKTDPVLTVLLPLLDAATDEAWAAYGHDGTHRRAVGSLVRLMKIDTAAESK